MLLGGVLAGVFLLRDLLLEPPSVVGRATAATELSHHDRMMLERLLHGSAAH
jgi:hypothetical protein